MISNNIMIFVLEFMKVLSITLALYIVFLLIAQKLYLRGVVGSSSKGKIKHKKIDLSKRIVKNSMSKAYISKEIKILLRNPIFFMQCVLPSVLMPIIILISFIAGISNEENMRQMQAEIAKVNLNTIYTVLIITGIVQFFSMIIYVSTTAISRDGQSAIFMKYIPISLYKQIKYKAMPNFILIMLSTILVLTIGITFFKIPAIPLIFSIIICILTGIIHSYLGILIDLKRPKLEWDTEYAVVKQNINLLWPMLISAILAGIIVLIGLALQKTPLYISGTAICLVIGFITYKIDRYIYKNQNKLFEKIV